jgi:hypothetical protein
MNQDTSQAGNAPPPPPGFVPMNASGSGAQPAQTAQSANPENPNNEGLYAMHSPDGRAVQIPYSKVHTSIQNGYLFGDKGTLQKYARDHAADPLSEGRVEQYLDQHPWVAAPVNALAGLGTGALKTATGLDRTPTTRGETELQLAAATPTKGPVQAAGEAAENVGEFFTGDELLSFLGKGAEGLGMAEKLKSMTGLAQTLEKYPMLAKVLKIGSTAVKQGTIAGGQTYAKTGGDAGAAATAAGETALASGALSTLGAGGAAIKTARAGVPEAAAAGSADYAAEARGAAEPHLNRVSDAIENTRGGAAAAEGAGAPLNPDGTITLYHGTTKAGAEQIKRTGRLLSAGEPDVYLSTAKEGTGYGDGTVVAVRVNPNKLILDDEFPDGRKDFRLNTGKPGGSIPVQIESHFLGTPGAAAAKAPVLDVNKVLDQIHDFTGAADRLAEVNDAGYSALDKITGGKFRALNAEVAAAQKASYKGVEGADALYKNKLAEMDDLIESTKGKVTPETVQALKSSWRQTYQLRDFGNIWDRNLNGVPGSSNVSAEQRGINGKGLMRGLQQAVRNYGRSSIEESLGPGRLENLENIARMNQTNPQRAAFNKSVWDVVRNLSHGTLIGGAVGGAVGHYAEGAAAGTATAGGIEGYNAVMNALKTNPKVAQNFLFALESGATAKRFGPFIAEMIQKNQTDASRERQAEEAQ